MSARRWPEWSESFIKSGFPESSLLAGTEPVVWEALGRLELKDFDNGKQVTLRKALEAIGLGWVATNTTPFRIAIGGLFDAAEKAHRENAQDPEPKASATASNSRDIPAIHVDTHRLPETKGSITGPINQSMASKTNRGAVWSQLETYGACVIRKAVSASALTSLSNKKQAKETKLARTMGNGVAGDPPGVYMGLSTNPDWHDSLEQTLGKLLIGPGAPAEVAEENARLNRKSILLLAGVGAENWAHQDNNDETPPVQAVLMLSNPKEDFTGGEFYVSRQAKNTDQEIRIVRYRVSFESPGDLVIFIAGKNSGWWHGMLPVKAGNAGKEQQEHLRKAVGILQPPE
jgi:hypothetical protein